MELKAACTYSGELFCCDFMEHAVSAVKDHPYSIELFFPDIVHEEPLPVMWLHTFPGEGKKIWEQTKQKFAMICVTGLCWNDDLSPWPAARVFASGEDFAGKAGLYLDKLTGKIVPEIEKILPFRAGVRGLAGYSMAGLFAVYAMYHTDIFQRIGTMSGSLWFDRWEAYAAAHRPSRSVDRIYVSLGSREHRVKNERMSKVRSCTDNLADFWRQSLLVKYELNPGGHFVQPDARVAKGLDWLAECRADPIPDRTKL